MSSAPEKSEEVDLETLDSGWSKMAAFSEQEVEAAVEREDIE